MSRLVLRVLPVVAVAGLLSACSSMPEWTKPSSWYDGVTEPTEKAEVAKPAEAPAATTGMATEVASQNPNALPPVRPDRGLTSGWRRLALAGDRKT